MPSTPSSVRLASSVERGSRNSAIASAGARPVSPSKPVGASRRRSSPGASVAATPGEVGVARPGQSLPRVKRSAGWVGGRVAAIQDRPAIRSLRLQAMRRDGSQRPEAISHRGRRLERGAGCGQVRAAFSQMAAGEHAAGWRCRAPRCAPGEPAALRAPPPKLSWPGLRTARTGSSQADRKHRHEPRIAHTTSIHHCVGNYIGDPAGHAGRG